MKFRLVAVSLVALSCTNQGLQVERDLERRMNESIKQFGARVCDDNGKGRYILPQEGYMQVTCQEQDYSVRFFESNNKATTIVFSYQ